MVKLTLTTSNLAFILLALLTRASLGLPIVPRQHRQLEGKGATVLRNIGAVVKGLGVTVAGKILPASLRKNRKNPPEADPKEREKDGQAPVTNGKKRPIKPEPFKPVLYPIAERDESSPAEAGLSTADLQSSHEVLEGRDWDELGSRQLEFSELDELD